ncbi:MAG TPA: FAD-dependent oxidoreductase, partial [Dermatophilaceae bacterium]|nr:FAD-dependent oxidoreductase [Dermatophilaceae bacterium]
MTDEAPDIYDVLVLGGGSGGYACALRSAQLGLRVALIERDKLGGTCLHRGCIPTKALLHAAEVADTAREGARFGVNSSVESIDMSAVLRYQQGVVSRLHKGLQGLISAATIDYVDGFGEVTSPTTVRVGDRTLTGRRLVLATGSRARSLPGLEIGGRVLTSDQALGLTQVPTSVIVLGGGVIGVEFASVFRSFGASVTIIEALPRLVPAEEESISKALERAFRKRGIVSRTNARFASVAQDDASVTVSLEDGSTLSADLLLVA